MPLPPYIGVTGITRPEQAEGLAAAAMGLGLPIATGHTLMAGYLVSSQAGAQGQPASPRHVPIAQLEELLAITAAPALNVIHYSTRDRATLAEQLTRLLEGPYERGLCWAVQLNMVWPDPEQVAEIARRFPGLQVTVCLTRRGLRATPPAVVADLARYASLGPCVQRVLLDPSGGHGKAYVLDDLMVSYRGIREQLPDLAVGFAGGLRADDVAERLRALVGATGTTDVSIDAEGGLRVPGPDGDTLDLERAVAYLERATGVLRELDGAPSP